MRSFSVQYQSPQAEAKESAPAQATAPAVEAKPAEPKPAEAKPAAEVKPAVPTPAEGAAPEKPAEPKEKPAETEKRADEPNKRLIERIHKLTARREEAYRQRDEAAKVAEAKSAELERSLARIAELEATQRGATQPRADAPERPAKGDYETPDDYAAALAEWTADRTAERVRAEMQAARAKDDKEAQIAQVRAAWQARLDEAARRYPDFKEVTGNPALKINEVMTERIIRSPVGLDIAYYLGHHPEVAARIAEMPRDDALEAMGALTASLREALAEPRAEAEAPPASLAQAVKPPTHAPKLPPPAKPLSASRGASVAKTPQEETMEEYAARRGPQIQRRR